MPAKGQFSPPVLPLGQALERAMEMIDSADCDVAIVMVGGALTSTKKRSQAYENNLARLGNNLVGVYNAASDARRVRADLGEFYQGATV
jgi:hypothetical protein